MTAEAGLAAQMWKGAAGPLTSALSLFALPLLGASFLPTSQFAMWSILASISTLALSLDFGGVGYLASRLDPNNRRRPFIVAAALTIFGSTLIGIVSVIAWVPFSKSAVGAAIPFVSGIWAIVAISAGSALRSVVQLQAQVALFDKRFALRNVILLGHALTALLVAAVALAVIRTAWALPVAWLAAGVIGLIIGYSALRLPSHSDSDRNWTAEVSQVASGGTYVWTRSLATVLRGFMMQGDKWIVGVVGGPAVLAAYEVAWRVAALPRFVAENLTFIIGLDATRIRAVIPSELVVRVVYCIRLSILFVVAGSIAVAVAYHFLPHIMGIQLIWPAFGLLLATHAALAIGAPISFIGNGIGMPTIDLPYLFLSCALCSAAAIASIYTGNTYVFVGGTTISLVLGTIWFWTYGMAEIKKR